MAALITDSEGNVLIVKPAHKEGWILPGGYVEVGESPSDTFKREMTAELGLTMLEPVRLLSVDYRGEADEYIMFIFDGGILTPEEISKISLPPSLLDYKFLEPAEAQTLLRPKSAKRLVPTLEARTRTGIAYLEHQELF